LCTFADIRHGGAGRVTFDFVTYTRAYTVLSLGDSTGVGVGAESGGGYPHRLVRRLASVHPGARLVNLCESGARSADVVETQLPRARRTPADLILLAVGINDVGLQLPEESFSFNLEQIAVGLAGHGAPVVICNIADFALAPVAVRLERAFYEKRIQLYNTHIEATAARHGFALVDLYAASRRLSGTSGLFSSDGFHPSAAGYEAWSDAMWPAVRQIAAGEAAAAGATGTR
jgi:acyl-CoA thioesterase I